MKNNLTKVLAVLLTLCMLMGMMIVPAVAEEGTQTDGVIVPDTSWYTPTTEEEIPEGEDNVYEIYTAAQLLGLSVLGQTNTFAEMTIKLMADIDLNPGWDATTTVASDKTVTLANAPANIWMPIPEFNGTIDGNGHTISGIYGYSNFTVPSSDVRPLGGFINTLENGEIKNLIVRNSLAVFESTSANSGTTRIHAGGFIGHVIDSTLDTLYVDIDAWAKFNYHMVIGGMICSFGTNSADKNYVGNVEDLVYAGSVGIIPASGGAYNHTTNGTNSRIGGMIGTNESWNATTAMALTMDNVAFIGNAFKPGKSSGDPLLCYTSGGNYNYKMGIDNSAIYISSTYWGADKNTTKGLTDVADDILNKEAVSDSTDTYAAAGWKSVTVADNVAYSNGAGAATIMLPGSVVDMINVSAFVQDTTSTNTAIEANTEWFGSESVVPEEPETPVFYLYDAADLLGLSVLANEGITFEDTIIKLMADIDLNPGWDATTKVENKVVTLANAPANVWTAIPEFNGTIDGNGHSISGIYGYTNFSVPASAVRVHGGFINTLKNGTIKNLIIKNSLSFFESTNGTSGTLRIHLGGLIGHVQDSTLTSLYVDMDTWAKFDYHYTLGGMICSLGTASSDRVYAGEIKDIVFAGTVGAISTTSNEYTTSGKRSSDKMRVAGMVAANTDWDYNKNVTLNMENIAFTGAFYWPGTATGDDLLCYTGSGNYNRAIGVNNAGNFYYYEEAGVATTKSAKALTDVADDIFKNLNASGNTTDTYADAGWVSVNVADNAAYANGAGLSTILLPGSVAAMLAANTQNLYLQKSVDGSAVRFIGVVNLTEAEMENFSALGFNLSMTYGGKTYTKTYTTTTVFTSLVANGETVDVSELGGTYFYAVEINGLDAAEGTVVFNVDGITVQAGETTANVYGSVTVEYTK